MFLRLIALFVTVICLATAVSAEEFRFSGDLGLRPIEEPARKSFTWEKNLGTAFQQAKQLDVPMVVVFTLSHSVQATNFLVELGADGLPEFVDKAVFVHVAIPAEGAPWEDPQGPKLVSELKLTKSPTVSVMSPNPLTLVEGNRMEGFFEMHELKPLLAQGITNAMSPEKTWRQPTIEGLVTQLSDAMRTGDLMKYTACLNDPRRSAMEKLMNLQINIGHAKRRLLAALEAKFGPQTERLELIEDEEPLMAGFQKTKLVELLQIIPAGERAEVRVRFSNQEANGATSLEERRMMVVRDQFGYVIEGEQNAEWCEQALQLVNRLTPVIADLGRITEGVESGMFTDAQSALELAKKAYNLRNSTPATAKN